jgi:hypothetical protein
LVLEGNTSVIKIDPRKREEIGRAELGLGIEMPSFAAFDNWKHARGNER